MIVQKILVALYPAKCAFCGRLLEESEKEICPQCVDDAKLAPSFLWNVQKKTRGSSADELSETALDEMTAVFFYSGSVKQAIQRMKFRNCPEVAKVLAGFQYERMLEVYREPFDFVVAVPMYPKKERVRGYNQSALLASHLANWLKIPFADQALKKKKNHTPLHELSAKERKEAISGSFVLGKDAPTLYGKRILLVDDVYTTGATMEECGKTLRGAGVKNISGIVIAITDFNKLS